MQGRHQAGRRGLQEREQSVRYSVKLGDCEGAVLRRLVKAGNPAIAKHGLLNTKKGTGNGIYRF